MCPSWNDIFWGHKDKMRTGQCGRSIWKSDFYSCAWYSVRNTWYSVRNSYMKAGGIAAILRPWEPRRKDPKLTRSLLFRDTEFMVNVSHSPVAQFYDFFYIWKKTCICQSHWYFFALGITVDHPCILLLNLSLTLSTLDTHHRSL